MFYRLGIKGVVLQCLNSYLRSYTQTVTIMDAMSVLAELLFGVPKGRFWAFGSCVKLPALGTGIAVGTESHQPAGQVRNLRCAPNYGSLYRASVPSISS